MLATIVLVAIAGLLTGCAPGTGTDRSASHHGLQPTAMTTEDGVEI